MYEPSQVQFSLAYLMLAHPVWLLERRSLTFNFIIIGCFGLEGIFRGQLAQHPCSEQGHLQLDQVAQSPV